MRTLRPVARRDLLTFAPAAPALTHIVSLVVHALPDALADVRELARRLPGAEVHDTADAMKLAIVLEAPDDRAIGDAVTELQGLRGLINVAIVAHIAEPTASLDAECSDE